MTGHREGPAPAGFYIHIPFCKSKCPYCDFYSVAYCEERAEAYTQAVLRGLAHLPPEAAAADTLYFGGGTPGLMPVHLLERIIRAVPLTAAAEVTLEANPGSVAPESLAGLRQAGFNRISFGVQSMIPEELAALGRRHTARQAEEAVKAAAATGFHHISADVMLGIPGQTEGSLKRSLKALCALPVDHISAYLLKIEEGTPFAVSAPVELPDEEETAALYLGCVSFLEAAGFAQYEISNFAKPGGESTHNLKYWLGEAYLGLGPAAHSFLGGQRFYFPRDLEAFLQAADPFSLVCADGPGGGFEEYAMLRLRLRQGLDLSQAAQMFAQVDGEGIFRRAEPLLRAGLVCREENRIALTPEGFLLSNSVTAALLFEA